MGLMSISLPDTLTADQSKNYILSIRLQPDGLSFYWQSAEKGETSIFRSVLFDGSKSYLEALKDTFFEYEWLSFVYRQIRIVLTEEPCLLVPEVFYDETRKQQLFEFTCSSPDGICLEHEQKQLQARLLFLVEKELYGFCERSLVRPEFIHALSPLIDLWKSESEAFYAGRLYVVLRKGQIDLIAFRRGALLFMNTFDCPAETDRLYFILSVWQRLDFDQMKDAVILSSCTKSLLKTVFGQLSQYIQHTELATIPSEAYLDGADVTSVPLDLIALSLT